LHEKAVFVQLLTEGSTPEKPASKLQLDSFISSVQIPYSAFRDPDGSPFFIADNIGAKHTGFVLDRETRKILYKGDELAALGKVETLP
jgi:hypothetical protein